MALLTWGSGKDADGFKRGVVKAMETKPASSKAPLSVARVLQIIKVLSLSDDPLSLAELSRRLATPKTSLIGLLRGLIDMNYVTFSDGSYRLGGSSFELAGSVLSARQRKHLNDYIRAGMTDLRAQTGETILYGVLSGDRPEMMTYVELVESRSAIRISVGIGDRSPLYCTAGGRILLAGMADEDVQRHLDEASLDPITASTEINRQKLLNSIRKSRQEDLSCVSDEMVQGITGMAAPIRDNTSKVLGALIVTGPTGRMKDDHVAIEAALLKSARHISASLGHREEADA
ncbi:MAG: IclR family transcriptional regulator [Novosphingobium sp.]